MNKDKSDACCQYTQFDATRLNSPALEEIQTEIGETEESRMGGLETLRMKLKELEDIEPCLNEEFLLRFLRVESFDSLRAFQRLKNFYDMQEEMLEMFKHCSIGASVIQNMPYFWALPYRPRNNSALLVVRMGPVIGEDLLKFSESRVMRTITAGAPDFSRIAFDEKSYLDLIAMNSLLMNPLTQMGGVSLIFDWSGFYLSSFLAFKPVSVVRLLNHMLRSFPMRIKEIHVVNIHEIFRITCNLFYFLLPKELRSCVFFHPNDDWKSLHQFIPPAILPQEYGGYLEPSSMINLLENVEKLEKQFGELFRYGYVKTQKLRKSLRLITAGENSRLT